MKEILIIIFVSSSISSTPLSGGTLGYGWIINNDGTATFENVNVRGTIRSTVFEYDRISAVGGSLYIAPTIYCIQQSLPIEEELDEFDVATGFLLVSIPNDQGSVEIGGRTWSVEDRIIYEFSVIIDNELVEFTNMSGDIAFIDDIAIVLRISKLEFDIGMISQVINKRVNPGALIVFYGQSNNRQAIYLTALAAEGGRPLLILLIIIWLYPEKKHQSRRSV